MSEKSIEHTLKELCKERYGSILQFTTVAGIPYTTFDSIIKRGINNSTVDNVIRICSTLRISADALARGEIRAYSATTNDDAEDLIVDVEAILDEVRETLQSANLIYKGAPVSDDVRGVLLSNFGMIDLILKGSVK